MKANSRVAAFTDKYPLIGPMFWWVSIQYLVTQLFVAAAWLRPPYSWRTNAISDLGNTACRFYVDRAVCSPRHDLMNASFIVLGCTMIAGSWLIYHEFIKTPGTRLGFTGMALAGLGTILVGLFPENQGRFLHAAGALLAFLIGNAALIVFGLRLAMSNIMRGYTLLSGVVALTALALYLSSHYAGLGMGGMERLVSYPQTLWLIVFGLYMTRNHYLSRRNLSRAHQSR